MQAATSNFGCIKCYKKSPQINRRHSYEYIADEVFVMRTEMTYMKAVDQIKATGKPFQGHRSVSAIRWLLYPYDREFMSALLLDGLHTIDEGMTTQFLFQMFGDHSKGKPYYISMDERTKLDSIVKAIKPPYFLHNPPLLKSYRGWKGIDFKHFVCYIGLFVLAQSSFAKAGVRRGTNGFSVYFKTFAKYVDAIRIVYSRAPSVDELDRAHILLHEVNSKFQEHLKLVLLIDTFFC